MDIVGVVFMLMLYIIVSEKNNGIHKQHCLRQLFC